MLTLITKNNLTLRLNQFNLVDVLKLDCKSSALSKLLFIIDNISSYSFSNTFCDRFLHLMSRRPAGRNIII